MLNGVVTFLWKDDYSLTIPFLKTLKGLVHEEQRPTKLRIRISQGSLTFTEAQNLNEWLSQVQQCIDTKG